MLFHPDAEPVLQEKVLPKQKPHNWRCGLNSFFLFVFYFFAFLKFFCFFFCLFVCFCFFFRAGTRTKSQKIGVKEIDFSALTAQSSRESCPFQMTDFPLVSKCCDCERLKWKVSKPFSNANVWCARNKNNVDLCVHGCSVVLFWFEQNTRNDGQLANALVKGQASAMQQIQGLFFVACLWCLVSRWLSAPALIRLADKYRWSKYAAGVVPAIVCQTWDRITHKNETKFTRRALQKRKCWSKFFDSSCFQRWECLTKILFNFQKQKGVTLSLKRIHWPKWRSASRREKLPFWYPSSAKFKHKE